MCTFALSVFEQTLIYLPLIYGAALILSSMKVPDLSLSSAFVFGAACASTTLTALPPDLPGLAVGALCVGAGLAGGAAVGLCSGLITHVGRVPHLLSAIITTGLFYGLTLFCLSGSYKAVNGHTNPLACLLLINGHQELAMLLLIGSIITLLFALFVRSQLGYACAIYGDNPLFFEHYRTSQGYVFIVGSVLGNALAGFSGYLFAQTSGFVDISMGVDVVLLCITALMLGQLLMQRQERCSPLSAFSGLILFCCIQQGLLKLNFNFTYFSSMHALVVLTVVLYIFNKKNVRISSHSDHLGV